MKQLKITNFMRKHKALTPQEAKDYEKIEERMRRAVKYADNGCRKARVEKVTFSREQKELLGKVYVLKMIFLRHKLRGRSGRPRSCRLKRIEKKIWL